MSFIKGLFPGAILTWVIALILGSNHSRGGFLDIHRMAVMGHDIHWSWPLFVAATGISWAIFWMME